MPISSSDLPNVLEKEVKKSQRGAELRYKNAMWRKMVRVSSTTKKTEREQDMGEVSPVGRWAEGAPRPELSIREQHPQAYTQTQYAGRMEITKVMRKFDQYGLMGKLQSGMLNSFADSQEIQIASMYENGHTSATVPVVAGSPMFNHLANDGQAYFSATHGFRDSAQTYANLDTGGDDLTEFTLFEHVAAIYGWENEHGTPTTVTARRLVIPILLEQKAHKVFESALEPSTANNAVNTAKWFVKGSFDVWKFLSDTGDWFILTSFEEGLPRVYEGWRVEMDSDTKSRNGDACIYGDYSWAIGFGDPRGAYKVR